MSEKAQSGDKQQREELELIRSVLYGFPAGLARNDALRAVHGLLDAISTPSHVATPESPYDDPLFIAVDNVESKGVIADDRPLPPFAPLGATWGHFDAAYKQACETSQPLDWMQAALIAQQIRSAQPSATATTKWKRGEQRVVCAANRDASGRIVTGARHFDAVMMEQIKRSPDPNAWRNAEQGFIDQFGKFLTREEARTVAERQGQILEEVGGNRIDLYSENIY